MALGQMNIYGNDKVTQAIERIKAFEPSDGYALAFSGGKDSICAYQLTKMAGVKFTCHSNVTSVDPPELVKFIHEHYPDVNFLHAEYPGGGGYVTMWNLIPKKQMPPTRTVRYCCEYLKERTLTGRFVITGVRRAESVKRSKRGGLEVGKSKNDRQRIRLDPDNPDQALIHLCQTKASRILNPIIDWTDEDVWEFIRGNGFAYPSLYDEGFKRLGCIGCPVAGRKMQLREFERWPKFKTLYIKAFDRMLDARKAAGLETNWNNGKDVMDWWLGGPDSTNGAAENSEYGRLMG
jgi:phosphoadenosine phosphosulfate reductase